MQNRTPEGHESVDAAVPSLLRGAGSRFSGADWVGLGLFLITFIVWTTHLRVGWSHPRMAGQEFRQAQTALSIQAIDREGFRLDYATPVLGKPWAIPMEFPLYQWSAALWIDLTGHDELVAGRWVSLLAFLAGLPSVLLILKLFNWSWGAGFMVLALIISTPIYAFFSAAVLIESMAWSASCWFLWGVLNYRSSPRVHHLTIAFAAGVIAVLVKPTTWAVACIPWSILWLRESMGFRKTRVWRPLVIQAVLLGVSLLLVALGWIIFADHVKSQNPMAHFLLSSELTNFNFGTASTKFSMETWAILISRWEAGIMAWLPLVLGLVLSLILSRSRALACCSLLGFVGIQLIFTNLYVAHDYYFYANAVYLVVAVAAGLAEWWDRSSRIWTGKLPAGGVFICLVIMNLFAYREGLFRGMIDQSDEEPKLAVLLRSLTDTDDVIVSHSGDWNSAMAFHSQRRMLMIPDSQMFFHPKKVTRNIELLAGESVPILMVQGEAVRQPDWVGERVLQLELHPIPLFFWNQTITFYTKPDNYLSLTEKLRQSPFPEISLPGDNGMMSPMDLPPLEEDLQAQIAPALSDVPGNARFPHGVIVSEIDGTTSLLVHAPTELAFRIPTGVKSVELEFMVSPQVYDEQHFDGLTVVVEAWQQNGLKAALLREWMPPGEALKAQKHDLQLDSEHFAWILFRVEAGPSNRNAFDQAWLKSFRFK